ncbi:MAG: helix-turn-helix transcriptional regulator [Planctomycetes bacterium]|nr:helix-turn-helix transcriptional regulator [Planctomycetota bacterium]
MHTAGMDKSTFSPLYEAVRAKLRELRRTARLSQRQLAVRLGRERSFVARIELGERRVDLVEFHWICGACGQSEVLAVAELVKSFAKLEGPSRGEAQKSASRVADSAGRRGGAAGSLPDYGGGSQEVRVRRRARRSHARED